jgi:nicotinic acid mononucleotide adenylyltransferase
MVSITFEKGFLTREEEGRACDLLTLATLLRLTDCGTLPLDAGLGLRSNELTAGQQGFVAVAPKEYVIGTSMDDFRIDALDAQRHLIYPGSFAPLHYGHEQVAEMAEAMTGMKVVFQLTANHPSKGRVSDEELRRRLKQFSFRWPAILLENAGLYFEKARLLPGFGFLIGADAVLGLLDGKFYVGRGGLRAALDEFQELGTRFYVVGRETDGVYTTLEDIPIPERHRNLFKSVSGRWDISSTQLRKH